MEPPEEKVGRAEAKQRRELNKAFVLALKKRAKGTAWRISRGVLFQNFRGWFVAAPAAVWVERRRAQIELLCKPMGLDPIFWEIVKTESNDVMPLSFRYHGAWTCRTPALVEQGLDERSGDAATIAAEAITWLDAQVGQFKSWSMEHFLQILQGHPRAASYMATIVTTMFMLGDYASAERLCRDAMARGDSCGFSVGSLSGASRSFPELALAWLERKRGLWH
jgi:hypothetical protein